MDQPEEDEELVPIRLRSRRLAGENTVFSIFFDHITGIGGHEVLQYLSVLPKRVISDMVTGVGVLPVKQGKFGLIRVFRHPLGRWSWEVCKGLIDADETTEQAAARELREETGFAVPAAQLIALGIMAPEAGVIAGRIQLFAATLGEKEYTQTADGELGHGELTFFRRDEIIALSQCGDIQDGCTLSALWKYAIQEHWLDTK